MHKKTIKKGKRQINGARRMSKKWLIAFLAYLVKERRAREVNYV